MEQSDLTLGESVQAKGRLLLSPLNLGTTAIDAPFVSVWHRNSLQSFHGAVYSLFPKD